MCGFVGFSSFSHSSYSREEVLKLMNNSIIHRGPDDEGYFQNQQINFGFRRLSIVGLSTGHQPMLSQDQKQIIVFNGEIYNYKELKSNLEKQGFEFRTDSDTEVVLHLYKKYGKEFLKYLNGMFAIALWDCDTQELIIARDRMGEKPLFYQIVNGDVIFASELKAMTKHPLVAKNISISGLNKFLTYEYVPSPFTILDQVYKVEAGEYIVITANNIKKSFYWQHPNNYADGSSISNENQAMEDIESLLENSIQLRLQADVPVGVLLSGGIDSSLVTAIAAKVKNSSDRIKSFSIYFNEDSYDESAYIKKIVQQFDLEHYHQTVSAKDMLSLVPKLGAVMDEPMADASIVPTYFLSKLTSSKVKTVMGGDGADEMFAGYPTYTANKLVQLYNVIPYELRTPLTQLASNFVPISNNNVALDFKLKQFFRGAGVASEIRFFRWMGGFLDSEKKSILNHDIASQLLGQFTYEDINRYLSRTNIHNETDRLLYLSQKLYLLDDILVKSDRASMQNSLEIRAPFLDHRLVEYVTLLPDRFKLKTLKTKYILKKLALKHLPNEIVNRPKKGFGIPITQWLREELKEPMLDLLSEQRLKQQGIFEYSAVKKLIDDHLQLKTNNRKLLWTLLSLQLWMDEFKVSL
ncbi:MAG: asparagine synthase (glutamine-hydrolyzing) [Candidatus Caenarcaniphilales bacterium]|jgi:asparagine synthase (glutamine-hydrolysing)|nr:asparagine synthase (glutamine-hydrolyzing) [Candidatus Caenarcaniphilales bacterium]